VSIAIDDLVTGLHIGDYDFTGIDASDSGDFLLAYTVPQEAAGTNLTATAMGTTSGLIATVQFTDSHYELDSVSITASGTTLNVSVTVGGGTPFPNRVDAVIEGGPSDITLSMTSPTSTTATTSTWTGSVGGNYSTTYKIRHVHVFRTGGGPAHNEQFNNLHLGSATTDDPPPVNLPPTIVCLDPTVELGQLCGKLGVGAGFGHKVDLSYSDDVNDDGVVTVYVQVSVDGEPLGDPIAVATVTDPDGDDLLVGYSGPASATLNGPGSTSVSCDVSITATDGDLDAEPCDSTVTLNAQIVYVFGGFGSPLSATSTTGVKKGSTVPVKFAITDCDGTPISTGLHVIDVAYHSGATVAGDPTVSDSGSSNDNGDLFRYSVTGAQWIFNLSTKPTNYYVGNTYRITARLDDATEHHVYVSLKK
jgi:hypothetical protein